MKSTLRATALGLGAVWIASAASAADAPEFPFNIQHSVEAGATFSAAKGSVFYAEKSAGRPGTFVVDAARAEDWPITIEPTDPLVKFPSSLTNRSFWGNKTQKIELHCTEKFGDFAKASPTIEGYPTICLVDTDQDQAFDGAVRAYSFTPMSFGYMLTRDEADKIAPVPYTTRVHHPDAGKDAVIELRYDGLKGDFIKLTAIARQADTAAAVYERQLDIPRTSAATVVIEHPVLNSAGFRRSLGHDRPPPAAIPEGAKPPPRPAPPTPIPTMTIEITKADAKSVTGKIVAAYPDWVWYRTQCRPARLPLNKGEKAPEAKLPEPPLITCEGATWRDGTKLISTGPAGPNGLIQTTTMSNEK